MDGVHVEEYLPMTKIGKKTPLGMGRETAIATKTYCRKKIFIYYNYCEY